MAGKGKTILSLVRTGGLAGIRPPAAVLEAGRLPQKARAQLEELLEKSSFFELPKNLRGPKGVVDAFLHTLTVEHEDGRKHSVTFTEAAASEALRELKRLVRDHTPHR